MHGMEGLRHALLLFVHHLKVVRQKVENPSACILAHTGVKHDFFALEC